MPDPSGFRLVHVTTVPMSLTFLRAQVGYMKARGVDVHAISSPGPELAAFGAELGMTVHAVEMPRSITPLRDLAAVDSIRRVLLGLRPAIVHAHTPKGGLLGMIAARAAGVPVRIYHMRGLPMMGASGVRRRILRSTERVSCRLAHRVLCVSRSLRDVAIAEGICPPAKIRVVAGGSGQGVDATHRFDPSRLPPGTREAVRDRLGIPASARVIGFVGRVVQDKGIVELAAAWSRLREEDPGLHLLLVGPFEPQDPIPEETRRSLLTDPRVHPLGLDWDTAPLYTAMDVLALPTYREGFPNVPLEAAAMELPVVATRIPGCVDAVEEGATGTLVPPRDADALGAALRAYLRDPALRRAHGRAGRGRVLREFRPEAIADAVLGEYRALLEEAGLASGPAPGRPEADPAEDTVRVVPS